MKYETEHSAEKYYGNGRNWDSNPGYFIFNNSANAIYIFFCPIFFELFFYVISLQGNVKIC